MDPPLPPPPQPWYWPNPPPPPPPPPLKWDNSPHVALRCPKVFKFLNEADALCNGIPTSFPHFQSLPPELRKRIWNLSLPDRRLLEITLTVAAPPRDCEQQPRDVESRSPLYTMKNHMGNIISGADYRIRMRSTGVNSPLLHVNSEASSEVHHIQRVHIPVHGSSTSHASRLHLCPERDTLLITVESKRNVAHVADFIHDVLAYDAKKKGILHIAITSEDGPSCEDLPIDRTIIHPLAQAAVASTIQRLQSVGFIRLIGGAWSHMFSDLMKYYLDLGIPNKVLVRLNRAYPLWSCRSSYKVLPVDPRPVSRYLDLIQCSWDPRGLIRGWRMLESSYNVSPISSDKMRVQIATKPMVDAQTYAQINTLAEARDFREEEEKRWGRLFIEGTFSGLPNPDDEESIEFAENHNAIGFWSIPIEAFGPVPEVPHSTHMWDMFVVRDLTGFQSQIELGLFDMS
ncbi:hypothetical protein DM02DRAFT_670634 [Periconia macrospinosa]|uniref:2EXR domain-containing protein n=1 Tax=Periconia macrospinosa TaxID=97972 RepID=A0A2V1DYQ4_9PLEO|nr:hypothetical protein DM02DRAFT_670634 [Periconia macrospinosa]